MRAIVDGFCAVGAKIILALVFRFRMLICILPMAAVSLNVVGNDGLKSDTLRIGYPASMPPYATQSALLEPTGILIDLVRLAVYRAGYNVEFIPLPATASLSQLNKNQLDLWITDTGFGKSEVAILPLDYQLHYRLYTRKDIDPPKIKSQIRGRFAVLDRHAFIESLHRILPVASLQPVHSGEELNNLLLSASVDGAYMPREIMQLVMLQMNMPGQYRSLPGIGESRHLVAAIVSDRQNLYEELQATLKKITIEERRELESKWGGLGLHRQTDSLSSLALTPEEISWISQNPVVKVGITTDWPPVEFLDGNGNLDGLTKDVLALLEESTGLKFDAIPYSRWSELLDSFTKAEIDMVAEMGETPKRSLNFIFSTPYWPTPSALLVRKDNNQFSRLSHLSGKQVAVVDGFQYIEFLGVYYPDIKIKIIQSIEEGIESVASYEADAFIDASINLNYEVDSRDLDKMEVVSINDLPVFPRQMAFHKTKPLLRNIVDKSLSQLDERQLHQLEEKWSKAGRRSGLDWNQLLFWSWRLLAVACIVILSVFYWNRKLQREIHRRKLAEDKLRMLATHDELTGLPNRALMLERTTQAIHHHKRTGKFLALVFVDLDNFKSVNDSYGHATGDALLVNLALRLRTSIRETDSVSRISGDEFVLLLCELENRADLERVVVKIIEQIRRPHHLPGCDIELFGSVGVAEYPVDGVDFTSLLIGADKAMYRAKAEGKNCYAFAESDVREVVA